MICALWMLSKRLGWVPYMNDKTLIADLEDLLVQATEERSHYYVGSVVRRALAELTATTIKVGEAGSMPGTSGFTMAVFRSEDVPVGTVLYREVV